MPASPGEKHHFAKLTEAKVLAMRERYARGGTSILKLASEYDVDVRTCRSVIIHETWKSAGGPAYATPVNVPGAGTFLVVDGVITRDPDEKLLRATFGCVMGCR